MKNKYYQYVIAFLVIIILGILIYNISKNSGSTNNVQTSSSTPSTFATIGNTSVAGAPTTKSLAGYYPIDSYYLTANSAIYYRPSATTTATMIKVTNPPLHNSVYSPLIVSGSAVGTWYNVGVFPVILTDKTGKIIAEGQAKALSNWQTVDMVPFSVTLTFPQQITQTSGVLVLKKANPSGFAVNDASMEIAVEFR